MVGSRSSVYNFFWRSRVFRELVWIIGVDRVLVGDMVAYSIFLHFVSSFGVRVYSGSYIT